MLYYQNEHGHLYLGDSKVILSSMEPKSVDMCITSPPYWAMRDYHVEGQLGQEHSFKDYISDLCEYFEPLKSILKREGTLWANLGDTYYGSNKGAGGPSEKQDSNKGSRFAVNKNNKGSTLENAREFHNKELPRKSLCLIPSRFAIEMQSRGWILRNDIIWHKPNKFPESCKDRFTLDYEHLFMFSLISAGYYFEQQLEPAKEESIKRMNYGWNGAVDTGVAWSGLNSYLGSDQAKEQILKGRNKRSVWSINTESKRGLNHFASYPKELIRTPIRAGCPKGGVVLDPFMGSGTTAVVSEELGRDWIGIELSESYCDIVMNRVETENN